MSLTRKRRKAIKRLRKSAEELWLDQQAVLDRANTVARDVKSQIGELTREEVVPRVKNATDSVRPAFEHNVAAARKAGNQARSKFSSDVMPALGGAALSAAGALGLSNNASVKKAIAKVQPPKKSKSVGGFVAIGAGVVALVGIGYAVWQTFRADDELWISEDEIDAKPAT